MLFELTILAILTILNGVMAMSELAVVSARPARLKVLAESGNKGAAAALKLLENPGRFLSTAQIGITAVGILAGAFSGSTLGARLSSWLEMQGMSESAAQPLGFGGVVLAITYLSLVVGELVPKQIALRRSEAIACSVASTMSKLAWLSSPLVWLLDSSAKLLLKLLRQHGSSEERVTEEEVRTILAEAQSAGVLEAEENNMISGVMRLADRSARALMTPRREVEFLDLSDPIDEQKARLRLTRKTRLPVQDGEEDDIVGVISVKDAIEVIDNGPDAVRAIVQDTPIVLDTTRALEVLKALRNSKVAVTLVFDEYGHFEGLITASDVLEAIAGVFQSEDTAEPAVAERDDGSFLVSGWMPADEFADRFNIPLPRDSDFETVAGFVLYELSHLPAIGEFFVKGGWRIEVIDLDGRRIDKLLLTRI